MAAARHRLLGLVVSFLNQSSFFIIHALSKPCQLYLASLVLHPQLRYHGVVLNQSHSPEPLDELEVLLVSKTLGLTAAQTGHLAQELIGFLHQGLPTPKAWLLSVSFLTAIAQHNDFSELLQKTFRTLDWKSGTTVQQASYVLSEAVRHFKLPKQLQHSFTVAYEHWLRQEYIAIRPSFVLVQEQPHHLSALNIKGESNLLESLLEVWSKLYQAEFLPTRYQEWQTEIFVPAAMVFEQMVNAETSGIGIFVQAPHRSLPTVTLFSSWGITENWQELQRSGDMFEVEPGQWRIIQRQLQSKTTQWVRSLDRLKQEKVQPHLQLHPSLTNQGAIAIAKMILQAQKGRFGPHLVDWAATTKQAYILDVRPLTGDVNQFFGLSGTPKMHASHSVAFLPPYSQIATARNTAPVKTAAKVMVAVANPAHAQTELEGSDGIGLLRAEWSYSQLPAHPNHLLEHNHAQVIRTTLAKTIRQFAEVNDNQLCLFRCQNFTTTELAGLPHGEEYEVTEPNPYLGYRGGVRIIHDYRLFDLELDALLEAHRRGAKHLGVLMPFVRSPGELSILLHHFQKLEYNSSNFLDCWLQCNTPENLLNLTQYAQKGIQGFLINLSTVHGLLHGVDPDNPDVFQLYPLKPAVLEPLLKEAMRAAQKLKKQVFIHFEAFDRDMLELVLALGVDGLVVQPRDLHQTKLAVSEIEQQRLTR